MTGDRPGDSSGQRAARWTRVEAVKDQWLHGVPPDTLAVLRSDPELGADKQIVLHLAYEEYCLLEEADQAPPAEEFAAQFASHRQSLLRLLAVHSFVKAHPNALKRPDVHWPSPGETLAEFSIVRELGRGGFAHVYLARETTAGNRAVVLKVSADGLDEGNTLGPLSHPHVMRVLAARRIGNLSVLVMPFLGAATLEDVASAKPSDSEQLQAVCAAVVEPGDPVVMETLSSPFGATVRFDLAIATVGRAVADALAFLHAIDLAHQDLKPSNVLLTPSGFPFLLDFNLTTQASQSRSSVGGTVPYMAPEQLVAFYSPHTSANYDRAAADVYSLGVILYELLAGRHPFPGTGPSRNPAIPSPETVEARQQTPVSLGSVNPTVNSALAAIVMACLSTDPTQRPSASVVASQLRSLVEPPAPPAASSTPPRSKLAPWLAILCLVTVMVVGLGVYFSRADAPVPPPPPATPFERGLILLNEGQFTFAGKEFLTAAEANGDGRAYALAAYCYAECKSPESAIFYTEQAVKLGFDEVWVINNRAYSYWQRNKLLEAKQDCDTVLARQPDCNCIEARFIRASIALLQGRPDDTAIKDISVVREKGPCAPDASLLAAHLYVARGGAADLVAAALAVREAVNRGEEPDRIKRDRKLMAALANHDDFKKAMETKPGPKVRNTTPCLIRPRE